MWEDSQLKWEIYEQLVMYFRWENLKMLLYNVFGLGHFFSKLILMCLCIVFLFSFLKKVFSSLCGPGCTLQKDTFGRLFLFAARNFHLSPCGGLSDENEQWRQWNNIKDKSVKLWNILVQIETHNKDWLFQLTGFLLDLWSMSRAKDRKDYRKSRWLNKKDKSGEPQDLVVSDQLKRVDPAHLLYVDAGFCTGLKEPDAMVLCQLQWQHICVKWGRTRVINTSCLLSAATVKYFFCKTSSNSHTLVCFLRITQEYLTDTVQWSCRDDLHLPLYHQCKFIFEIK